MPQPRAPRPALTHFLCIPLVTPASRLQLADRLASFQADVAATPVLQSHGGGGGGGGAARMEVLPAAAVRPVGTLHLTLGVLCLGGERLAEAIARLQTLTSSSSSSPPPSSPAPPSLALRGLYAMQPPARAAVLYAAPVDESTGQLAAAGGPVWDLCLRARAALGDLLEEEDGRPLLLHATLVNTTYARPRGTDVRGRGGRRGPGGGGPRGQGSGGRLTFDARPLLDRYADYGWAEGVAVRTVALCRMGAQPTAVDDDGVAVDAAYAVEAEVAVGEESGEKKTGEGA